MLAIFQRNITKADGTIVPNAQITVKSEEDGLLAPIFEDRDCLVPLSNPFNADADGFVKFYVDSGTYEVSALAASGLRVWNDVVLVTTTEILQGTTFVQVFDDEEVGEILFSTLGVPAAKFDSDGNLLIGTDISDEIAGVVIYKAVDSALLVQDDTSGAYLYSGDSQSWLYTATNTPLVLGTNNLERLRVTAAGNIIATGSVAAASFDTTGTVNAEGNIQIDGAGKLGYATGSGGAVTQATNRTTAVTLNKTNGAITMVNAAGSTTAASFTVNNNTVEIGDTVIVNQRSGTNLYDLMVTAVAAGSFRITFRTTGGTSTDAPVLNFSVIKAVST